MTKSSPYGELSRRERQIMDIVYRLGRASAADVRENLPDPPSYSAVRAMLRVLEEKGHVAHEQEGPRYVFRPTVSLESVRESATRRLMRTFFDNSVEEAVATLLDVSSSNLTEEELDRLVERIREARKEGR
ncbi:MAG: BlaI/MecI/CopY family transcriptional regulator [Gemmatimonadota bacterium]|nr:BlaI/MecI/CopY family transcriptional regulator [Gemmatimonadota bacterium]